MQSKVEAPDGTAIAYNVSGRGPALVLTNGLTTTSMFWKYLVPRWRESYRVVTWDLPGHAGSEPARTAASATIEGQPAIIARIMDELELASATHIGFSVGCQIVIELARRAPERCDALVALFGSYRHALRSTSLPVPGTLLYRLLRQRRGDAFASLVLQVAQLARIPGGFAPLRQLHIIGRSASSADMQQMIGELRRLDAATCAALACSAEEHSTEDVLAQLRCPLLIMAGGRDRFAPPDVVGKPLHRAVPHSTLIELPEATHTALLDHHEPIAECVGAFLRRCADSKVGRP